MSEAATEPYYLPPKARGRIFRPLWRRDRHRDTSLRIVRPFGKVRGKRRGGTIHVPPA